MDALSRTPVETGYTKGVPMGSVLKKSPGGSAPSLLVGARKGAFNGNLDHIQIVKGWLAAYEANRFHLGHLGYAVGLCSEEWGAGEHLPCNATKVGVCC